MNDSSYSEVEYKKHLQLRWKELIGRCKQSLSWGSGGWCSVLAPWDAPSLPSPPGELRSCFLLWHGVIEMTLPYTIMASSWQNSLSLNKCEHSKGKNDRTTLLILWWTCIFRNIKITQVLCCLLSSDADWKILSALWSHSGMETTDLPYAPAALVLAVVCIFCNKKCPPVPSGRQFSCLSSALEIVMPFGIHLVFSVPPKMRGDQVGPCSLAGCT